jgi:sulfonate transport system permease protein
MKKKKSSLIENIICTLIAPVLIIVIWQLAGEAGMINTTVLPLPGKILSKFIQLIADGKLFSNLAVSIWRVIQGFFIGTVAGLVLGTIMGLFTYVNKILNSLVGILRPVPMIAWIPLLILWIGIGEESKVAIIVIGSFWPVLLNTIQGIKSTDVKLLEVATILEKSRWTVLTNVILPNALPSIITGMRLGSGTAWSCVVAAEMIAASKGIGYMIMYAREMSQPATIFVGVFSIGAIGLLIDKLFLKLERHLLRWNYTGKQ